MLSRNEIKNQSQTALSRVFTDKNELGFWDSESQRILSRLDHDLYWNWRQSEDLTNRYGLFCLSMILLCKQAGGLDTRSYDKKITAYLGYIQQNLAHFSKSDLTYGAFNSAVLGQVLYPQLSLEGTIREAFGNIKNKISSICDNQDGLFMIGSGYYLDLLKKSNLLKEHEEAKSYLRSLVLGMLKSQDPHGFFQTGDLRAFHHQRNLYILWGLTALSRHFFSKEIKQAVEKSLNYLWACRRTARDNGFWWHPRMYWVTSKWKAKIPVYLPDSAGLFFECHQTFFANAVKLYQHAFGESRYSEEKKLALEWILGHNRARTDLRQVTGQGFPARVMAEDGNFVVRGEMFKGSYELGSFIMAFHSENI